MPQKALVVLVVFVALVAGIWLALPGGDAPQQPQPEHAPAAVAPAPAPEATPAAAEAAAKASAPAAAERTAVTAGAPASATAGFELRGRLVDRKGAPRRDLELRLRSWPDGLDLAGEMALPLGRRDDEGPRARTGADGRFLFRIEKGRGGQVDLDGVESVLAAGPASFAAAKADVDLGDLEVQTGATISGLVQDARGTPLADVKVSSGQDRLFAFRSSTVTDASGKFEIRGLRAGKWHLRTLSGKFLPATAEVELAAEQRRTDVLLQLEQGRAIAGQVVDDRGVPVADLKVGSNRRETRGEMQMERFSPDEATTTDQNGYFTLAGLQGDAALVRAFGKGYAPAVEANVAVGTGNLLLTVQRLATVSGTLRDPNGRPLAGSRVRVGNGNGPEDMVLLAGDLPMENTAVATTAADGTFRIDNVKPGVVTVRARGKQHRPATHAGLNVQPGQTIDGIHLVAEIGAVVRAKVVDEQGNAVVGAKVAVQKPKEPKESQQSGRRGRAVRVEDDGSGDVQVFGNGPQKLGDAVTDAEGMAEVAGLPAGPVVVLASHEEHAEAQPFPLVLPASGVADTRLTLRKPGFAALLVTRTDGTPAAAQLTVHGPIGAGEDERDRNAMAGADGRAQVGPLPAGDYWAEVQLQPLGQNIGEGMFTFAGEHRALPGTRQPFRVLAATTTEVPLRLPVLTKVHGKVTGADGPAAGVVVELEPVTAPGEGGPPELEGTLNGRTDADGTYAIAEVTAGEYRIRWGKPGQLVKASAPLTIAADTLERQVDLELRHGVLKLQAVTKADGEGVENAEVELQEGATDGKPLPRQRRVMMFSLAINSDGGPGGESTTMTMGGKRAKTDVDGFVEIADVPPGTYTVRVSNDRFVARELPNQTVAERTTTDCGRVELDQASRIRGRVTSADGKPVPMAMVLYRKKDSQGEPERQPAMSGNFTLSGLAPGRWVLTAQSLGEDGPVAGPAVEVEVAGGRTESGVELRLPAR